MKVTVVAGKRSEVVELPTNATLEDLKKAYKPKIDFHRKSFKLQITDGGGSEGSQLKIIPLHGKQSLKEQGVKDGDEVIYKDLGPQVGYRTVFVAEYAGPIAIMLLYAMRPSFVYGNSFTTGYGYAQRLYIPLFLAHFIKRELETFFVHKFSRPTMPLRNIFRNCAYYWTFALFIGYVLCHPQYTEASSRVLVNASAVAMVIFELFNFAAHKQLGNMRSGDGDTSRRVPEGVLFSLVSCPNYTFEVLSWAAFSLGTSVLSSWFFTFLGFAQMAEWAVKKHKDYIKMDSKAGYNMETVVGELHGDALLSANLEYLASLNPPATRPVLPQLQGGAGLLPRDFQLTPTVEGVTRSIILQVNAVEDVSFPLAQRLRNMVAGGNETEHSAAARDEMQLATVEDTLRLMESDEPASTRRGRRQRLLRLTLTDGFTRVVAVEDCRKGCNALRNGVAWGAKLQLFAPLQIRHGVLILTSERTVMLGGFVPELQSFWLQYATARLEEMSGRPKSRCVQGAAEITAALPPVANMAASSYTRVGDDDGNHQADMRGDEPPAAHLNPQPLSAWQSHRPPTAPFTTVAVISEVTSELTIGEDVMRRPGGPRRFSLFVLLSTPPSVEHRNESEAELVVDLGHDWLREALGMDTDAFYTLSVSRHPDDMARLNALVENIGRELENFGIAIFVLRQREADGVIETIKVSRLQSSFLS